MVNEVPVCGMVDVVWNSIAPTVSTATNEDLKCIYRSKFMSSLIKLV